MSQQELAELQAALRPLRQVWPQQLGRPSREQPLLDRWSQHSKQPPVCSRECPSLQSHPQAPAQSEAPEVQPRSQHPCQQGCLLGSAARPQVSTARAALPGGPLIPCPGHDWTHRAAPCNQSSSSPSQSTLLGLRRKRWPSQYLPGEAASVRFPSRLDRCRLISMRNASLALTSEVLEQNWALRKPAFWNIPNPWPSVLPKGGILEAMVRSQ